MIPADITTEDVLDMLFRWGQALDEEPVIAWDGSTLKVTTRADAKNGHWPILEGDPEPWVGLIENPGELRDLATPEATEILREHFGPEIAEARHRWQAIAEGRWYPWQVEDI